VKKFKRRWEITQNGQLIYPFVGVIALAYSVFKLALLFSFDNIEITILISCILFFIILKLTLVLFKFLEKRWKVDYKWRVIKIFLIFAVTGTSSVIITNPISIAIGLVKDNFADIFLGNTIYYVLKFMLTLPFYKILLVTFGWLFGEFIFFWNFTKKMLSRFGLKRFLKE
jgi:uncharacterized protein DUF6787